MPQQQPQQSSSSPSSFSNAQLLLLDRLVEYLGDRVSAGIPPLVLSTPSTNHNNDQQQSGGLTLPASAVSWLSQALAHDVASGSSSNHGDQLLQLVESLLPHATHLRLTSEPWPQKRRRRHRFSRRRSQQSQESTTTANNNMVLNMYDFRHVHVLWLDGDIPLDGCLIRTDALSNTLSVLRIEHNSRISNLNPFLYDDTNSTNFYPHLKHIKLSHCNLGERSGLRGETPRRRRKRSLRLRSEEGGDGGGDESNKSTAEAAETETPIRRREDPLEQQQQTQPEEAVPAILCPPPMARLSDNLRTICLSYNELETEETALAGLHYLKKLVKLDLSNNRLTKIAGRTMAGGCCSSLQVLHLSHNQIDDISGLVPQFPNLRELWLEHNQLSDLHTTSSLLASLHDLKDLKLQGNPLQYSSLTNQVKRNYRVDVFNAFRERRFESYSANQLRNLSLQNVQDRLPLLDGQKATYAELKVLSSRTFVPIVTATMAVSAAARQTTVRRKGGGDDDDNNQKMVALDEQHPDTTLVPESTLLTPTTTKTDTPPSSTWVPTSSELPSVTRLGKQRAVKILNWPDNGIRRRRRRNDDDNSNQKKSSRNDIRPPDVTFTLSEVVGSLVVRLKDPPPSSSHSSNGIHKGRSTTFNSVADGLDQQQQQQSETERMWESTRSLEENIGKTYLDSITVDPVWSPKPSDDDGDKDENSRALHPTMSDITLPIMNGHHRGTTTTAEGTESASPSDSSMPDRPPTPESPPNDLANLSLSMIKAEQDRGDDDVPDLRASQATTATTADTDNHHANSNVSSPPESLPLPLERVATAEKSVRSDSSTRSPATPAPQRLSFDVPSFSDNHWQDDASSIRSSVSPKDDYPSSRKLSRREAFQLAEVESEYNGPPTYKDVKVLENLELYFRLFVFASSSMNRLGHYGANKNDENSNEEVNEVLNRYPRIQLWPVDRQQREESFKNHLLGPLAIHAPQTSLALESFRRVWRETIVACGKPALRRLTPSRAARFGFHGELLWSTAESSHVKPEGVVEAREAICCLSDTCFYIIVDHDAVIDKTSSRKTFPRPIPRTALFNDAKWPHALACHPFESLKKIVIGFGFQRLTLHFADSSSDGFFTYILLTSNKMETVALLKELQELATTLVETIFGGPPTRPDTALAIENDDRHVLDAVGFAVRPDSLGVVLHYQILQQRWKRGERGAVRRVVVVTDTKLYLLDEDYVGDGSEESLAAVSSSDGAGESKNQLVNAADLSQIIQVKAADEDPNAITIVVRQSTLSKAHNWRLYCRSREGAERLVEDVRKALTINE